MTPCIETKFQFSHASGRKVVASFDGGDISSDGGVLLLGQVEEKTRILQQFADCFTDHRDPNLLEHTVLDLVRQRVFGLALGYEDLNDHDDLRIDPLLATVVGKADPTGQGRRRERDCGKPLAGKSTLNRMELTPVGADTDSRYKKIVADTHAIRDLFVEYFLQAHPQLPAEIVLDLDATDDPVHGEQLGRFFHGYYREYCFLPLYIFCGDDLLCARLRPADIDASAGALSELRRIVGRIRAAWPTVRITIRADSGFCRDHILNWCEAEGIEYVIGLAQNPRLLAEIQGDLATAEIESLFHDRPARCFRAFDYRTRDSWTRSRRVIAKAEYLPKGANPRFIVVSPGLAARDPQTLYEQDYCARGECENRIKEQQLYLFADRTSASTLRANQLRLWLSSLAYTLLQALRRLGLQGTALAKAQCGTIRVKLLKIGALVRVTVRKIWISLSSSYPYRALFTRVLENLGQLERLPQEVPAVVPTPLRC